MRWMIALALLLLATTARADCPRDSYIVLVDTGSHTLTLCDHGKAHATFKVALGQGGVGKEKEGDAKTPLGRYTLGEPKKSKYRSFMLLGYPTREQREAGLTGSAVGLHGPPVGWWDDEDDEAATATDWTLGCIALSARNLATTVAWVTKHKVRLIELR